MKIQLNGRRAVVTGSTAGIGFAIAEGLARAGASVVINGRGQERVAAALKELRLRLPEAELTGVAADLSTSEGSSILADRITDADILVNNLGTAHVNSFFDQSDAEWLDLFQLNVMSGVRAARHYMPGMVERGWGRVVFISSESALNIPADMIHYGFTKTAVLSIARGLAKRMAGSGVTVNSVLPGPTLSDGMAEMLKGEVERTGKSVEAAAADFVLANRPSSIIRRAATVEEVANMVVYTCSAQASATTGAALRVDGGVVDSL